MTVLRFPKHTKVTGEWPYDDMGGCSTCGTWEGEVPTDCPGVPMTEEQKLAVMAGKLDFIWKEGWTTFPRSKRLKIKGMLT